VTGLEDTLAREAAEVVRRSPARRCPALFAVGHDLVCLAELAPRLRERFIARVFTAEERAYAADSSDPVAHYGARWAAKEAAYKAFCGLASRLDRDPADLAHFRDYGVALTPAGVPTFALVGAPGALFRELSTQGDVQISLSLTHEGSYAAAFVLVAFVPSGGEGNWS
jgi:holo-[acyl-carrier protein] synthase